MTQPPLDPDQPGFVSPGEQVPAGSTTPAPVQADYFGFSVTERWMMPDGVSYMEVKILNEGDKAAFQKLTQSDVVLARGSGDAKFKMDPAKERHALIQTAVVGWNLLRNGAPVPLGTSSHNKKNLEDWLLFADPALVEKLEEFIRVKNPWLRGEMTVKDIDEEIKRLEELREEVVAKEAGEGSSSNK